jgi:hypothetical protein
MLQASSVGAVHRGAQRPDEHTHYRAKAARCSARDSLILGMALAMMIALTRKTCGDLKPD